MTGILDAHINGTAAATAIDNSAPQPLLSSLSTHKQCALMMRNKGDDGCAHPEGDDCATYPILRELGIQEALASLSRPLSSSSLRWRATPSSFSLTPLEGRPPPRHSNRISSCERDVKEALALLLKPSSSSSLQWRATPFSFSLTPLEGRQPPRRSDSTSSRKRSIEEELASLIPGFGTSILDAMSKRSQSDGGGGGTGDNQHEAVKKIWIPSDCNPGYKYVGKTTGLSSLSAYGPSGGSSNLLGGETTHQEKICSINCPVSDKINEDKKERQQHLNKFNKLIKNGLDQSEAATQVGFSLQSLQRWNLKFNKKWREQKKTEKT